MNHNKWVCWDEPLFSWTITLPATHRANQGRKLIEFAQALLEAGEEEQVFTLYQTADPYAIYVPDIKTYIDYMQHVADETNILPFFGITAYRDAVTTSRICYYDEDGLITEAEIPDAGALLKQLHHGSDNEGSVEYWSRSYPLLELGSAISVDLQDTRPVSIYITIWSDIWLPQGIGWMEDKPAKSVADLYDNRELAACHTPRLNSFLARAKAITLDFDADWRAGFPYHPFYRHMSDGDAGIRLDI